MSTIEETTAAAVAERAQATREAEADAARAAELIEKVNTLREDVAKKERTRDKFKALGGGHVEYQRTIYDQGYGRTIELEPDRSRLKGAELAETLEPDIDYLRGEIAKAEAEIDRLVGPR